MDNQWTKDSTINGQGFARPGGRGTYKLTDDFALSHHTDPLHDGRIVRDINFTPDDRRLPDVAICRIFSSRKDAERILAALLGERWTLQPIGEYGEAL